MEREIAQSTKIYDRTGEHVLYEIHGAQQRTIVELEELPDYVAQATIAMEDKDFYKHGGISIWGILRGVIWKPLTGRGVEGGSTLTQQFVKNAILTNERTIIRKLKEWILAYKLEQKYEKDEILQMYFNEIPYGSTAYGVEAASQKYFGKSARDISLAESAILAALPQGPSRYSPYGPNLDLLIGRQHYILDLMVEQGYVSEEDADIAKAYELEFKEQETNILAPHFVMYIKELLSEKYGEKTVEQGGLKIITTLDLYKQEIAEEVIKERGEINEEKHGATNAALVSIDPKTGQVLAMVGSRDYFNDEIGGQFNVTTSRRQPGSSLKPLVYTACFLKGYTPNTILYDVVTNFSDNPDESYEPHNYNLKEFGPVTIRKALAGSLNIPAVKAIYLAGVDNVVDLAKNLGYTTLNDKDRFGLSLVLGGAEVKLIEHTNAYGAFAREGILHDTSVILKVEDAEGKVLEEWEEDDGDKVIDAKIARMTNDILSDNSARAYAFGEENWLTLGERPVAAKTGTTNDYRDAWTVGYTPSIVTGVWVGNNDNSKMNPGAAGGVVAAPIWNQYMKRVLGDTPIEQFKKPEIPETGKAILDGETGMESVIKIDKASGLLATEYTPENYIEEKIFAEPHSILYYIDKDDPLGDKPENPAQDPQFELWESRVLEWAKKQRASSSAEFSTEEPPTEYDNVHLPENIPTFTIKNPNNNQTILENSLIAEVDATAPRGISHVNYYVDNNLLYSNNSYPFNLRQDIYFLKNGYHELKVVVCDDVDNCATKSIEFNLASDSEPETAALEINLIEPSSGLAVTNFDFPLKMRVTVNNPEAAAKVNFYASNELGGKFLITSSQPVETTTITKSWEECPGSGNYKVSAELIGWQGQKIETKESLIIINNVNDKKEESEE
jgi:1A family penicillin-binding protein